MKNTDTLYTSVFQPFCCSGTLHVWQSLTEPHAMINEFSGVGEVEFLGCLGTDVSSEWRNREPVRVWTLGHIPQTLTIKQQAKDSFNVTVLDNII